MDYYDSIAPGYDDLYGEEQRKKLSLVVKAIGRMPGKRLLDVGCGTGISFDFFDCECYGIDPSEKLLQRCSPGRRNLVVGMAEDIPFRDKFFDVVISISAVHNFTDVEKGLTEMRRVGKGLFVITVLKKSGKAKEIGEMIHKLFGEAEAIEEAKDLIYVVRNS